MSWCPVPKRNSWWNWPWTCCRTENRARCSISGTGSGAIALSLASERPAAHLTGVDVSAAALAVAAGNSPQTRPAAGRLAFGVVVRRGARRALFDLIVANPPYVAGDDPALRTLTAEPLLALCPGPTGLEAFAEIIRRAARHLRPRGSILLEHGADQAGEVARLLERGGFGGVRTHPDYSGIPRVTRGSIHSSH